MLAKGVVACITLLILVPKNVMTAVVCKRFMFYLMYTSVTFLCVLMCFMLNTVFSFVYVFCA